MSGVSRVSVIVDKRNSAVLVSEGDWKAIQETMYLLSVPGMRKSLREAMAELLPTSAKVLPWPRVQIDTPNDGCRSTFPSRPRKVAAPR